MKKIFISGSGGFGNSETLTNLPQNIKSTLDEIIKNNHQILVGDCQGVDTLIQRYCKDNQYSNVHVYYTGYKARNSLDANWTKINVPTEGKTGRLGHMMTDLQMSKDADLGIAIWNHVSKGTGENIKNLKKQNKPVFIYDIEKKEWEDEPQI